MVTCKEERPCGLRPPCRQPWRHRGWRWPPTCSCCRSRPSSASSRRFCSVPWQQEFSLAQIFNVYCFSTTEGIYFKERLARRLSGWVKGAFNLLKSPSPDQFETRMLLERNRSEKWRGVKKKVLQRAYLFHRVEVLLDQGWGDDVIDVGDGLGHTLAMPVSLDLVAKLQGLIDACK